MDLHQVESPPPRVRTYAMSRPIIPWAGGKRRLVKHLYPHFPAHDVYVEAFAGGAAALFMRANPAPLEIINDINGELVNLYRCVRHHLDELVRQFRWSLVSRQISLTRLTFPSTLLSSQSLPNGSAGVTTRNERRRQAAPSLGDCSGLCFAQRTGQFRFRGRRCGKGQPLPVLSSGLSPRIVCPPV